MKSTANIEITGVLDYRHPPKHVCFGSHCSCSERSQTHTIPRFSRQSRCSVWTPGRASENWGNRCRIRNNHRGTGEKVFVEMLEEVQIVETAQNLCPASLFLNQASMVVHTVGAATRHFCQLDAAKFLVMR